MAKSTMRVLVFIVQRFIIRFPISSFFYLPEWQNKLAKHRSLTTLFSEDEIDVFQR